MSYKQIGNEDYSCISKMLRAGFSYSEIGRTINKNVSSVSRHVRENGGTHKKLDKKIQLARIVTAKVSFH